MNATIKDIAKASGVGISTVSRVLNGSGSASPETKRRVMEAVRELNYVPNSNARNLKKGRPGSITLLAKSIANPFFQKVIHGIESLVMLRGYSLEIKNVGTMEDEMLVARRESQNGNVAGIILLGGSFAYTDEDFRSMGIPCVLVTVRAADSVDRALYSSVVVDDEVEMAKSVRYLIELGHRRIGCIYNSYRANDVVTPNVLRLRGYRKALQDGGIEFDENLVSSSVDIWGSGYEFGFHMMKSLMVKNPDMTAVVTMADIMAIGAAKAVLISGRRIPEDISIVGFDGIEEAEYYNPALDTIAQPARQMAQDAVDALALMMSGGETSHIVLESQLIKRNSSMRLGGKEKGEKADGTA